MASDKRPPITLACETCKRRNYVTTKNKTNTRERVEFEEVLPLLPAAHRSQGNSLAAARRWELSTSLTGRRFGPFTLEVSAERVHAFVTAIGDDPKRWSDFAPPVFANAALFTAAPVFLDDAVVVPFTRSLIHSEQRYTWTRPLAVGEMLEVSGTVTSVRVRGPLHFVEFAIDTQSKSGPWMTGSSVFLMSTEAAAASAEEAEPPGGVAPGIWHHRTQRVAKGRRGASFLSVWSLARRPGSLRRRDADWNPIHWDHDSARNAGLSGTIVHGLLMASWMANAVGRHVPGVDPLRELRVRFRNPLRPGVAAEVTGSVVDGDDDTAIDVALAAGDERLVTGRIRVTP